MAPTPISPNIVGPFTAMPFSRMRGNVAVGLDNVELVSHRHPVASS